MISSAMHLAFLLIAGLVGSGLGLVLAPAGGGRSAVVIMALLFSTTLYWAQWLLWRWTQSARLDPKRVVRRSQGSLAEVIQYLQSRRGGLPAYLARTLESFQADLEPDSAAKTGTRSESLADYMSTEGLVGTFQPEMMARLAPTLTGLGILGTFLGLARGVAEMQGAASGGTDELSQTITGVVAGLSFAFDTSIWGIGLSVLVGLVNAGFKRHLHGLCDRWIHEVDLLVPRSPKRVEGDSDDWDGAILEHLERIEEYTQSLANDLAHQLNESLSPILADLSRHIAAANTSGEGAAKQFTESMVNNMTDAFGQRFEALGEVVEQTSERFESLGSDLVEGASRLHMAIERQATLAERIEKAGEVVKYAFEAGQPVVGTLNEAASGMQRAATQSQKTATVINRLRESLERSHDSMLETVGSISTVADSTRDWADETTKTVDRFGVGLQEVITRSLGAYDQSLVAAVRSLQVVLEELEGRIEDLDEIIPERVPETPTS